MKAQLKRMAEGLMNYQFWIERATERKDVEKVIRSLRPRRTVAPLIRIGPAGDGGYLVPDDLLGITACISPGVGIETGFDRAMADRGIDVYMADASASGAPEANERFHFTKKFVDVFENDTNTRLDSLCASTSTPRDSDLILQMDIEGAEWRVLLDASADTLKRFRIMVIEFHGLQEMFGRFSFGLIESTFIKLLQTHSVVHIHPNNICAPTRFNGLTIPSLLEITFYRNDGAFCAPGTLIYPHGLDADCVSTRPTVVLPECWQLNVFDLAPIRLAKVTAITILKILFRNCFRFWTIIRGAAILQLIRNVFWSAKLRSLGDRSIIYRGVVIHHPERVSIGRRCSIAEFVHMWGGGGIEIGDDVLIASHVALTSQTHDKDAKIYRETMIEKPIVIEDNVRICTGAVVLPGVRVGSGAIIGAGAIVTRDVAPRTVVKGVPAREHVVPSG